MVARELGLGVFRTQGKLLRFLLPVAALFVTIRFLKESEWIQNFVGVGKDGKEAQVQAEGETAADGMIAKARKPTWFASSGRHAGSFRIGLSQWQQSTNLQMEDEASHHGLEVNRTRIIDNLDDHDENNLLYPPSNYSQTIKALKQAVDIDKSANNFTRFISYGPPRTASTVQFNMVCVCFFLHLKVHKPTLTNATKCYFQKRGEYNYPPLDQPQVMKTHDVTQLEDLEANSSGIFFTARTKERGRKMADNLKKSGGKVGLMQDLETLSEIKAVGFLDLYADFFDLPSQYLPMLHNYYTLWDELRCCCGVQMSKYWRYELNPSTRGKKLDPHPFCGSLDIDVVEKALMNTTIFKMIDSIGLGLREIIRPSLRDDALDGSYCSRYNEAVRTKGLGFNERLDEKKELVYNHSA